MLSGISVWHSGYSRGCALWALLETPNKSELRTGKAHLGLGD